MIKGKPVEGHAEIFLPLVWMFDTVSLRLGRAVIVRDEFHNGKVVGQVCGGIVWVWEQRHFSAASPTPTRLLKSSTVWCGRTARCLTQAAQTEGVSALGVSRYQKFSSRYQYQ